MRDEVLSSVGAQNMDKRVFQVSDLDDNDFYWAKEQWDVHAVFSPRNSTLFCPTAFDNLEMGGSAENRILLDEKEDKENCPSTTPVSERPS